MFVLFQKELETAEYDSDLTRVESLIQTHHREHQEVGAFRREIDRCINDRVSTSDRCINDRVSTSDGCINDRVSTSDRCINDRVSTSDRCINDRVSTSDR